MLSSAAILVPKNMHIWLTLDIKLNTKKEIFTPIIDKYGETKTYLVSISSTFLHTNFSYKRCFGSFSSYMYLVKAAKTYFCTKNSYI